MKLIIGILISLFLLCVVFIIIDSTRFRVVSYTINSDKLSKETRIAFLSDLHNKQYKKSNWKLKKKLLTLNPDLVLLGGDMITAKPDSDSSKGIDLIDFVNQNFKSVYAYGNHEYRLRIYPDTYKGMYDSFLDDLSKRNIKIYDNEMVSFDEISIYAYTMDKAYYKRFHTKPMEEDTISKELGACDSSTYSILLAHNPDYFKDYIKWGADLTLSGHVHGGVVRIPFWKGVISPKCTLFPKYDGGLFKKGNQRMIVSRGLGMHTIPFRLFNPAEIVMITLKPLT